MTGLGKLAASFLIRPGSGILFSFLVTAIISPMLHAQEMLGVVNGNYSGVSGIMINPANASLGRHKISINILSSDLFVNSNYIYVNKADYNFFKLFSLHTDDPRYMHIYDYPEFFYRDTVHYFDYFKNSDQRRFYMNGRVEGPSATVRFGKHAISLLTGWRNNFSAEKIPPDAANFIFRGQDFLPQQNITYDDGAFAFTVLSWIELGLGYSYTFYRDGDHEINAGIGLKGLLGTGAAYGIVQNVSYMVPNNDSIYFYRMNASMGLDLPMDYATNTLTFSPLIRGYGFSGDIGINYIYTGGYVPKAIPSSAKSLNSEQTYLFRIGLSLLDAGWIRFSKMVQVHEFNDVNNRLWSGLSDYHSNSIQHFIRSASQNLLGDSAASLTGKTSFNVFLPTAVSLQFDYNAGYNIFINATFDQGIRLGTPSVRRPTLFSVTPRFETPAYEISLPLSLLDLKDPAIGLAIRIYGLVIGTEKLGTFLHLTNVRGIDLYFSLGFNLDPKSNLWGGKSRHGAPCDAYPDYKQYKVK